MLVDALGTLEDKEPCLCHHLDSVEFGTTGNPLRFTICDHCFGPYHMPKPFFKAFYKQLDLKDYSKEGE